MASFLRMTRQARWLKYPELPWLSQGELQSDALLDLQTRGNRLSLYRVDTDEETEEVVVALAATRQNLANLDYAVFDQSQLADKRISIRQEDGDTPHLQVNRRHYDISELSVGKLAILAQIIANGTHCRVPKKTIKLRLRNAVRAGDLDRERMNCQLLNKLE